MTYRRHTILMAIAAAVLFVFGRGVSHAEPPPPHEPPKVEGPIEYVGPDTYILLDAEGRPQPVLGMTYDEFVAAWKKLQNVEAGVARAAVHDRRTARSRGRAKDDRAELHVEVTVRCASAGPIRVPLGMANAILKEQPRWEIVGAGESSISRRR